jgi:hypothetical protein
LGHIFGPRLEIAFLGPFGAVLVSEILDDLYGFLRLESEILDDLYGFLTLESEILDDLYGFLTLVFGFCTSRTS